MSLKLISPGWKLSSVNPERFIFQWCGGFESGNKNILNPFNLPLIYSCNKKKKKNYIPCWYWRETFSTVCYRDASPVFASSSCPSFVRNLSCSLAVVAFFLTLQTRCLTLSIPFSTLGRAHPVPLLSLCLFLAHTTNVHTTILCSIRLLFIRNQEHYRSHQESLSHPTKLGWNLDYPSRRSVTVTALGGIGVQPKQEKNTNE